MGQSAIMHHCKCDTCENEKVCHELAKKASPVSCVNTKCGWNDGAKGTCWLIKCCPCRNK
jgi:hypothetical protein